MSSSEEKEKQNKSKKIKIWTPPLGAETGALEPLRHLDIRTKQHLNFIF